MNDRNPAGAAIAYGNVRAALRLAGAEDEHGKTYNRDTALDVLLAYVPALLIELDRLAAALAARTKTAAKLANDLGEAHGDRDAARAALAAAQERMGATRAEVKTAVEEWFADVDLTDLYRVKGWSA